MPIENRQLNSILDQASRIAETLHEVARSGGVIRVVSHFDADGLAAAGILGKALVRLGGRVHIRIERWLDEEAVEEAALGEPSLLVFTDLGSGSLDLLTEKLKNQQVIILDHHPPLGEAPPNFLHLNPHLHGVDGSRDLSGAGVSYLVAKAMSPTNVDLASIAIVGSLGDLQDKYERRSLGGLNRLIVEDAVQAGYVQVEVDLLLFGRETRPIHKALARTTNPYIPGISGEEDRALAFLTKLGISPKHGDRWRTLRDLSEEEKRRLYSALADHLASEGFPKDTALNLIGHAYTLTREEAWTPLHDAREFAVLLNATGRMGRHGLGVAICMGARGPVLEEAEGVLEEYRRTITKYLSWLWEENRIEEARNIYIIHGEDQVSENLIGTISSILSTSLPKPVIAYAAIPDRELVKVSARGTSQLVERGLDLGRVMAAAAMECSGRGGGHDIAAGAQVPTERLRKFLQLVDRLVGEQLG